MVEEEDGRFLFLGFSFNDFVPASWRGLVVEEGGLGFTGFSFNDFDSGSTKRISVLISGESTMSFLEECCSFSSSEESVMTKGDEFRFGSRLYKPSFGRCITLSIHPWFMSVNCFFLTTMRRDC